MLPESVSFLRGVALCLAAPFLVVVVSMLPSSSSTSTSLLLASLLPPLSLSASIAFFAVASYVTLSEHPARLSLADDTAALLQWKPSYKRAATIQAPLAALAALLGVECWRRSNTSSSSSSSFDDNVTREPLYLLGAAAAAFNLPFTVFVILPTNSILLDAARGTRETRRLLVRWGHLHFARTVAGGLAAASFLVAVAREAQRNAASSSSASSISSWAPFAAVRHALRLSKSDYGV